MREDTSSQAAPTTTTTTAAAAAAEPALQALPKAHVNAVTVTALSLTLATMAVMLLFCLRR
jgi:cobalamin biosynthesis protein CbiD